MGFFDDVVGRRRTKQADKIADRALGQVAEATQDLGIEPFGIDRVATRARDNLEFIPYLAREMQSGPGRIQAAIEERSPTASIFTRGPLMTLGQNPLLPGMGAAFAANELVSRGVGEGINLARGDDGGIEVTAGSSTTGGLRSPAQSLFRDVLPEGRVRLRDGRVVSSHSPEGSAALGELIAQAAGLGAEFLVPDALELGTAARVIRGLDSFAPTTRPSQVHPDAGVVNAFQDAGVEAGPSFDDFVRANRQAEQKVKREIVTSARELVSPEETTADALARAKAQGPSGTFQPRPFTPSGRRPTARLTRFAEPEDPNVEISPEVRRLLPDPEGRDPIELPAPSERPALTTNRPTPRDFEAQGELALPEPQTGRISSGEVEIRTRAGVPNIEGRPIAAPFGSEIRGRKIATPIERAQRAQEPVLEPPPTPTPEAPIEAPPEPPAALQGRIQPEPTPEPPRTAEVAPPGARRLHDELVHKWMPEEVKGVWSEVRPDDFAWHRRRKPRVIKTPEGPLHLFTDAEGDALLVNPRTKETQRIQGGFKKGWPTSAQVKAAKANLVGPAKRTKEEAKAAQERFRQAGPAAVQERLKGGAAERRAAAVNGWQPAKVEDAWSAGHKRAIEAYGAPDQAKAMTRTLDGNEFHFALDRANKRVIVWDNDRAVAYALNEFSPAAINRAEAGAVETLLSAGSTSPRGHAAPDLGDVAGALRDTVKRGARSFAQRVDEGLENLRQSRRDRRIEKRFRGKRSPLIEAARSDGLKLADSKTGEVRPHTREEFHQRALDAIPEGPKGLREKFIANLEEAREDGLVRELSDLPGLSISDMRHYFANTSTGGEWSKYWRRAVDAYHSKLRADIDGAKGRLADELDEEFGDITGPTRPKLPLGKGSADIPGRQSRQVAPGLTEAFQRIDGPQSRSMDDLEFTAGRPLDEGEFLSKTAAPKGEPVSSIEFQGKVVQMGAIGHTRNVPLRSLVRFITALTGKRPSVKELEATVRGLYSKRKGVQLNKRVFADERLARKVMAHEVGHAISQGKGGKHFFSGISGGIKSAAKKNKGLRDEMKKLSDWWRPRDSAEDAVMKAYRDSFEEQLADAVSVLFNDADELKRRAPNLYQALFDEVNKRDELRNALMHMYQQFAGRSERGLVQDAHQDMLKGFAKAEEQFDLLREEARQDVGDLNFWRRIARNASDFWADTKNLLVRRGSRIIDKRNKAIKDGAIYDALEDPDVTLDVLDFSDSAVYSMMAKAGDNYIKPIRDAGIDLEEAGALMAYQRIAKGDRSRLANPFSLNERQAKLAMDALKEKWGAEKFAIVEKAASDLRDAFWPAVELLHKSGAMDDAFFAELKLNRAHYHPMHLVDFFDPDDPKKVSLIPASIKKQVGNLSEKGFVDPATAMMWKGRRMFGLAARNLAAQSIRRVFEDSGEALKELDIPGPHTPANIALLRERAKKRGMDVMEVLVEGERRFYEVEPYVADVFEKVHYRHLNRVAKVMDAGVFRAAWVLYSAGFQLFNLWRDANRTMRNLQAHGAISNAASLIPFSSEFRMFSEYSKFWRKALDHARGKVSEETLELMDNFAISPPGQSLAAGIKDGSTELERLANQLGPRRMEATFFGVNTKERFKLLRPVAEFGRLWKEMSIMLEAAPKLAANDILKRKFPGMSAAERAHIIRNDIGTPNFHRRGTLTRTSNAMFTFSNIAVQSLFAESRILSAPKTRAGAMTQFALRTLVPKMLQMGAKTGAVGAAMVAAGHWSQKEADEFTSQYERISEYQLRKYTIVPLGETIGPDGTVKTRALRIPSPEWERMWGSFFWDTMRFAEHKDRDRFISDMTNDLLGELPFIGGGGTPKADIPLKVAEMVTQGGNPTEPFKGGRKALRSEEEGGELFGRRGRGIAFWTLEQTGIPGQQASRWFRDPGSKESQALDEAWKRRDPGHLISAWPRKSFLDSFGAQISGIGRFYLETDAGTLEKDRRGQRDHRRLQVTQHSSSDQATQRLTDRFNLLARNKSVRRGSEYERLKLWREKAVLLNEAIWDARTKPKEKERLQRILKRYSVQAEKDIERSRKKGR